MELYVCPDIIKSMKENVENLLFISWYSFLTVLNLCVS